MEESSKPFKFNGTAGGYFVVSIVTLVMYYIIIIGWPIAFNFAVNWIVDNLEINGRKLKYSASYGETLIFLLINTLLTIITLGIYIFWFVPKSYRFVLDHTSYADEVSDPIAPVPAPAEKPTPTSSTPINI